MRRKLPFDVKVISDETLRTASDESSVRKVLAKWMEIHMNKSVKAFVQDELTQRLFLKRIKINESDSFSILNKDQDNSPRNQDGKLFDYKLPSNLDKIFNNSNEQQDEDPFKMFFQAFHKIKTRKICEATLFGASFVQSLIALTNGRTDQEMSQNLHLTQVFKLLAALCFFMGLPVNKLSAPSIACVCLSCWMQYIQQEDWISFHPIIILRMILSFIMLLI